MNDIFEELAKLYPDLCQKSDIRDINVEYGWFNILNTLFGLISDKVDQARLHLGMSLEEGNQKNIEINQKRVDDAISDLPILMGVREKHGLLDVYGKNLSGYDTSYIKFAKAMSLCVCRTCGNPGEFHNYGYGRVECNFHFKETKLEADGWIDE
jgi:hypothetical protein